MPSSTITTAAQVCNYALRKVGYKMRVGNLYDGSEAAKVCLDIYGQKRDHALFVGDWDFAERTANGTLLKQSPTFPPSYIVTPWTPAYPGLPWAYEYAYPDDAVGIRAVKNLPAFIPNFDPRYNRFSIDNDAGFTPPKKVILTNVSNAIIVYTGQITDPAEWDDVFLETLADDLGEALGPVLMGLESFKIAAAEEQKEMALADYKKQRG